MKQSCYTAAKVDFNRITGKLRPEQHGSNSCPPLYPRGLLNFDAEFKKMNFWGSRTHDWALWNNGQRMIDTHFVFPLMHLDPADPANYYFESSDAIIKLCRDCGMRVFYRMGTSIEHTGNQHFNTIPPKDYKKYAEVLAGIIRHYTKGWANGYEYEDMQYWEIWNEPELGGQMWTGTYEEFCEFFAIVLKRLKDEFPHLKIGGPAFCSFSESLVAPLLDACEKWNVKPDFISWHSYTEDVDGLINYPKMAREYLDARGYTGTETCINEWHYLISWHGVQSSASTDMRIRAMQGPCGLYGIDSGCFNLAVLTGWQDQPLDSGYYYGAGISGAWGYMDGNNKETKNSFSMKMFGRFLAEAENKVACERNCKTVYAIGAFAKDGRDGKLLVTDFRGGSSTIEIEVEGMEDVKNVSAVILDNERDLVPVPVIWQKNQLILTKKDQGSAAFYVTFER